MIPHDRNDCLLISKVSSPTCGDYRDSYFAPVTRKDYRSAANDPRRNLPVNKKSRISEYLRVGFVSNDLIEIECDLW